MVGARRRENGASERKRQGLDTCGTPGGVRGEHRAGRHRRLAGARGGGAFSWARWGVAVASGLLLHTAANLWNDYFDFVGGVDRADGAIGSGVLVHGELTPTAVWRAAWGCAIAAGLGGVWLAMQVGWGLLALGVAGVLGAVAYCAGARSPKRRGLGEQWVFLWMGLGMTEGGYLAQTGRFSWSACVAGAVLGIPVALLLFVANARDLDVDREAGVHTLAHWVDGRGRNALAVVAVGMLSAAFALLAAFGATGLLPRGTAGGAARGAGGDWNWVANGPPSFRRLAGRSGRFAPACSGGGMRGGTAFIPDLARGGAVWGCVGGGRRVA